MWKLIRYIGLISFVSLQSQTITQMTADQIASYLKALPNGQSAVVTITTIASTPSSNEAMGIMFPFYIYPTATAIQPLVAAKQQYPQVPQMIILNPNSGPGASLDSTYATAVSTLQRAGIIVVGYIATGNASRSLAAVQADVDKWYNWYKPNGIFFDEAYSTNYTYYKTLTNYVHGKGMQWSVANPGTNVSTTFGTVVDTVVIAENSALPNLANYGNWQNAGFPATRACMMAYNQPSISQTFLSNIQKYVGWVFLTNDSGSNPYDTYPSYFNQLVASCSLYGSAPVTSQSYSTVIIKTV